MSHFVQRAALISDYSAVIQTPPAEAARPWTRGERVARCACLFPAYAGTKLHRFVTKREMCVSGLPKLAVGGGWD